jgi:SAM-dependent methyltransferase
MIANTISGCTISGIDFSDLMYYQAMKRNKKFVANGRVHLLIGDFLTQEPVVEKYDKVFCLNVIYFWSDLHLAFSKVNSLLNNEGVFCIFMTHKSAFKETGFSKDFNKYSIESVEAELLNSGFKSVEYFIDNGYFIKAIK